MASLWKRKGSNVWQAQYYVSLATGEELKSFTLETWSAEWLRRKARDSSKATMARYHGHVDAFLDWLGDAARLSWKSVDLQAKRITLIPSKTKKKREVRIPIQPDLLVFFEGVTVNDASPDAPFFPTMTETPVNTMKGLSTTFVGIPTDLKTGISNDVDRSRRSVPSPKTVDHGLEKMVEKVTEDAEAGRPLRKCKSVEAVLYALSFSNEHGHLSHLHACVRDVARREVFSIGQNATLGQALDLVMRHRITVVPVIDEKRKLPGLLSDRMPAANDFYHANAEDFLGVLFSTKDLERHFKLTRWQKPQAEAGGQIVMDMSRVTPGSLVIIGDQPDLLAHCRDSAAAAVVTSARRKAMGGCPGLGVWHYSGSLMANAQVKVKEFGRNNFCQKYSSAWKPLREVSTASRPISTEPFR